MLKSKCKGLLTGIALIGVLSGCSRLAMLDYETSRDNKQYRKMVDQVFEALDNRSNAGLKDLFAPNVINVNPDIDHQIDGLLQFYKGPKESDEGVNLIHSDEYNDYGVQEIALDGSFEVTAGGGKIRVYLAMQSRNDHDKDDEGLHMLDFATEEAYNGKYFLWHQEDWEDIPGIYLQTSDEKRSDIMMVESNLFKYKSFKRELTADDFLAFAKTEDDYEKLVSSIGEANGCDKTGEKYYFELGNQQFVVCGVTTEKIKYLYLADENKEIRTLWLADDRMKANGKYMEYLPLDRELTEDYFKSFPTRSTSLQDIEDEIGAPSGEEPFISYYKLSDNRYVGCYCTGDKIHSIFVADAENELYTLWEESGASDSED